MWPGVPNSLSTARTSAPVQRSGETLSQLNMRRENPLSEIPGHATTTATTPSTNLPTGDVHVHVQRAPSYLARGDGKGTPPIHWQPV
jgi:hypothetical protein